MIRLTAQNGDAVYIIPENGAYYKGAATTDDFDLEHECLGHVNLIRISLAKLAGLEESPDA